MKLARSKLRTTAASSFVVALVACTAQPSGDSRENVNVGSVSSASFVNGGFETGTAGLPPPSWTVETFLNNGITVQTPQTRAGLNLAPGGAALTTEINGTNQPDIDLGATASLRWSRYGSQCARVNFHSSMAYGHANNVNSLSQTMTVGAGDVDATDGKIHIRFAVAPVLQNPSHFDYEQPYYFVQVTNVTRGTILYTDFNLSGQPGVPWKTINGGTANEIDYVDWALVDIAPGGAGLTSGDQVKLEIIAAGCSRGGHFGEVYVDGIGTTIPGLNVSGTAPAQVNAGSNLTYTLTYRNGSAAAETGVVIDFTTPPNTTYQGITTPAGATCTVPGAGVAGTVVCTFASAVAASASGSFTITVNVNAGATGQITAGTYDIHSTQETPLLGNKIVTLVGCGRDADCAAGTWCHESATNACVPTLSNGTAIPSDPPHTNPTLNGTCTAPAGALVCTSAVCDTTDNKCGYANGDGTCSAGNATTVCRSAVCDLVDGKCGYVNGDGPCGAGNATTVCRSAVCDTNDGKCGYANGDGPCSAANAATVCRSGACSLDHTCLPAGGCNVDGDCAAGNWCNESAHTCVPKLTNGTSMPSDPPHTNPTLDGTCTAPAATLVCASAVCDAADNKCGIANGDGPCTGANGATVCRSAVCDTRDNKCGLADGDGPCSAANGATVCRSGACSANLTCEPAGGCNVDADCTGGKWCMESTHTCTARLGNGTAMPTDAPHTNPTLDGKCTATAGELVCASGVCDTDNKCGLADGDGPCSAANAATVCRSGACSANGKCEPAGGCNVDADCASGNWCNETAHACTAKLPNGTAMPSDPPHTSPTLDSKCTDAAATLVCASAVCDAADDKCGLANGDGPCTAANGATVCRSGVCSTNGKCEPAGGCNVDADCAAGAWCNETAHACTPKLGNGAPMPTDAPHTNPTLDGKCTAPAATLVCVSGVCDAADNKCGLANGDGPCTADNGATVCRSAVCVVSGSNSGVCAPCIKDADCPAGEVCNAANACVPRPGDAGAEAGADAGAPVVDSGIQPDPGTLEGGGCACDAAGTAGAPASRGLSALGVLLGALVLRRRRATPRAQVVAAEDLEERT